MGLFINKAVFKRGNMAGSGKITQGEDRNFYVEVNVSNTNFSSDCNILVTMLYPESWMIVNEGSSKVYFSLNGTTIHGTLTPSTPTAAMAYDNRPVSKIWLKIDANTAASKVTLQAWSKG